MAIAQHFLVFRLIQDFSSGASIISFVNLGYISLLKLEEDEI